MMQAWLICLAVASGGDSGISFDSSWTVTATLGVGSNYVFPLGGASGNPSLQLQLDAACPSPTGLTPFLGATLYTGEGVGGSELDLLVGCTLPSRTTFLVYWYNLEPINRSRGDLTELSVLQQFPVAARWTVEAGVRLFQLVGVRLSPRPIIYGGALYKAPLTDRWSLAVAERLGYDAAVFVDAGWLSLFNAEATYQIGGESPRWTATAYLDWSQPVAAIQSRDSEFALGGRLGATW